MSNLTIFGSNRTNKQYVSARRSTGGRRDLKLSRAIPGYLETLENRQYMSLLGVAPGFPSIFYDTTGTINYTYNATTQQGDFVLTATAKSVTFTQGGIPDTITNGTLPSAFTINILVDGNGNLISQAGPNLIITGQASNLITHHVDDDGILLEGDITQFGSLATGTDTNDFDFRFTVDPTTPGLLGSMFAGKDIGVTTLSKGNSFTGDFTQNFIGGAKNGAGANGTAGPIPKLVTTPPPSSLGGFVFEDLDDNGILNNTDVRLNNIQLTLTGTDYLGNPVNTTTNTGPDGSYLFDQLAPSGPGGYTITENQATVPAPLLEGMDSVGTLGGDGTVQDVISNIQVPSNTAGVFYDFGEVPPSSISGNVFYDANNNGTEDSGESGLPGVTVTLTGTDDFGNPVNLTTTTLSAPDNAGDQIGYYQFTGLRPNGPNEYVITETQPTGYGQGIDLAGSGFTLISQSQDVYTVATPAILPPAGAVGTLYNFGELLGSLSGTVFFDTNDNGIQNSGEPDLQNITVQLISNNAVINTTATDSNGYYEFDGLLAGNYQVQVTAQNGESFTIQTPYQNGGSVINSIADATGLTPLLALAAGGSDTNVDAGLLPATPTINTAQQPATAVVGSSIADKATVTGGYNPTGSVTFELFDNIAGAGTPLFTDANVTLVNGMATSVGYIATATGTDYWVAIYNGDANNSSVTSPAASEPVVITPATPAINTAQQPATAVVGSSIADKATITGGYNPTGSVTFELFDNIAGAGTPLFTDANVTLVNGMATSVGYIATATGTDYWVAIYNGDANNSSVTSPAASEPVVITPATPTINTAQQPATAVVGSSIADKATVTGGYNPTGSVTFELFSNAAGTGTPLFTSANVAIVNGMATSPGYIATATGTDYWVAIYNGDANNSSVTSPAASEPVVITPSAPTITTTPGGTVGNGITISGTKFLDLTGNGFSSDDTTQSGVTFNLYKQANNSIGLQTGAGGDTLVGTTTTGTNGAYSFSVTSPGTYYVTESVPSGYIQTGGGPGGSAGNTYYTINAQAGYNYNGYIFDDFMIPTCLPNNISFKVTTSSGSTTTVTNLAGNTRQGDTVTAMFSVPAGMTDTLSLVSYIAPTASWSDSNAYQQQVFQSVTGTFLPGGPYTLTVKIPNDYYQIDFICGQVINQLEPNQNGGAYGPDSANILYHAENRFLSSDNSGTTAPSSGMLNSMSPTIPALTSTANATTLTDSAILSGGMNPTGSITFYLMPPGSTANTPLTSAVYTDRVTVNGNGPYSTANGSNPGGFVPTVSGTYQWVAVYSGNAANSGATSLFGSEPEVANVAPPACLSGTVYVDYCNNGCINSNDVGLSGVTVQLLTSTGTVLQSTTTNSSGVYSFSNIAPGTYTVYVPQSQSALNGYTAGKDAAGTVGGSTDGSVTATNTIGQVTLASGQQGINYNFGETAAGQTLCCGDCGSIAFWCGSQGQSLLNCLNGSSNCTNLGNWLCNTYGNLWGKTCGSACMSGKTNSQVCSYFQSLCNNSNTQCQAQVMCAAINCYVTNTTLCGSVAGRYGFNCCSGGCGSKQFNVWDCGSVFSTGNYCTESIQQLLSNCNSQASKGCLYGNSSSSISKACEVFTACNQAGNIGACS